MKKFLSIIALTLLCAMLVGVLCSCSKVRGKWKDEDGAVYEFKAGGKGTISYGPYSQEFKYKVKGNKLEMTINGKTETSKFKVKGKTLTILDDDGNEVETLTKTK